MKKLLVLMMCVIAVAFASCKPDPDPEPEPQPQPEAANKKFLGNYDGIIYLNGTASAPELASFGYTEGMPIDSMAFNLSADITEGETDESVNVLFSIKGEPESQTYETTGNVSGNTISFGDLTYKYVEGANTFDVTLTLTGTLKDKTLNLSGPATGSGQVFIEPFPVALNLVVDATVDGHITRP